MRHVLRQLVQIIFGGANPRAGTGLLTCSVTLASALWVSVSMPNLPLLRGLDDRAGTNVSISLQSALLGIDDRSGHESDAQALARALGLSDDVAKLLARGGLRDRGNSRVVRTPFVPIIAQLDPLLAIAPAPAVQPPDAQPQLPAAPSQAAAGPSDVTPTSVASTPSTEPTNPPVVSAPVVPVAQPPHPKSGATPTPPTPTPPTATPPATPHDEPSPAVSTADSGPSADDQPAPQTTTAPSIHAHADLVVEAAGPGGANVPYAPPTAADAVDGGVSVACAPASGHAFHLGHTTVSCTAVNTAHNVAHSAFDVLVHDTTGPAIQAHADLVVEASGPGGANVSYTAPTASDAVDGTVSVVCAPASGSMFALGHTAVTCTATDAAHNATHSSFDVLVGDTTGPAVQAHVDLVVEATAPGGATVTYTAPAASDSLDGPVPVSCFPASGSVFALGHTTVTCTATDAAHNTSNSSFDVLVGDTTGPVIQAHADLVVAAAGPGGATVTYTTPTASDAVDTSVSVVCAPASGHAFPLGHTTVGCTATDAAHNTTHSSFDVLVDDTTPPVIQAHVDIVAEATGPSGATVTYSAPAANDALDGPVPVSCAPASGSTFALGHTTVTCSAHDAAGNAATPQTFDVHVRDTTAPTLQAHADVVAEADSAGGATVNYTAPAASDSVDTSVSVTCAPASGTVFAFGHTTVTCSAHDASGNAAPSQTFDVHVHDTTAPAIQAHADVVAEATGPGGATVSYTAPTASDAVDGSVSVSCAPASGTAFAIGHTTVTCTAQDARSNVAHSTFDVHVRDTTAPVIQVPSGMTVQAPSSAGAQVTFTATATDAVDGTDTVTCAPASGTTFPVGHTIVTCTAHDAAGNQATSQTFDVYVTSLPTYYDAVLSLFGIAQVIQGFGLSHSAENALYDGLIATANAVFNGDAVATCQAFDGFTTYASSHLTAGQFTALTPSVDAARTTLGC